MRTVHTRLARIAIAPARRRRHRDGDGPVSRSLFRDALAPDRPHARRTRARARRRAEPAERVLHRVRQRRRLALDRLRLELGAALRSRADRIDRRDRRRAVESEHHLRRHGRRDHPARPRHRRRRVQVHRRRQDLAAPRPARQPDDRDDRRRSRRTRTGCSSRRSAIRTAPTPSAAIFRSTDGGETFQKVLYKDEYTSGNDVRIDPNEPEHRLRDALAAAAELHRGRRVRHRRRDERHLQVHRRRHHLEAADRGPAGGLAGEPRDRAEQLRT